MPVMLQLVISYIRVFLKDHENPKSILYLWKYMLKITPLTTIE